MKYLVRFLADKTKRLVISRDLMIPSFIGCLKLNKSPLKSIGLRIVARLIETSTYSCLSDVNASQTSSLVKKLGPNR